MEVDVIRNLRLPSLKPPKPSPPVRKTRPIAVWVAEECLQGAAKRTREMKSTKIVYSSRNSGSIYERFSIDGATSESLILNDACQSQCLSPVTSGLLPSDQKNYFYIHEKKLNSNKDFLPLKEMDEHEHNIETVNLNKPKISIEMDEHEHKNKTVSLNNPKISLNSSIRDIPKKDNVNKIVRSDIELPGKTVSCIELPTNYLKSSSCTDIDSKTVFFNEKGWPVKVMRLTEDSPPKTIKPWPTRSLPTTSCKKSPRKDKSIFTQKKSLVVKRNLRKSSESSKEDKENKKTESVKEILPKTDNEILSEQYNKKETVDPGEGIDKIDVTSDLKSMLQKLDETMDKLASEKDPSQVKVTTSTSKKKTTDNTQKSPRLERKTLHNDIKKDNVIHSARSNKHNSKEVKAYMQAKRVERKIQMSEETRKRQDLLEMQKKNLEKLKEKALQVLKKSSTKTVDENKPKWQGPLEQDNSEVLPPAIHIFETKIPTARKSKTNMRLDDIETYVVTNTDKESCENISSREPDKDNQKSEEIKQVSCASKEKENMDSEIRHRDKDNSRKKLRLSKTNNSIENPPIRVGMEAAAMEIVPQLKMEMANVRKSLESQMQSPKLSKDWKFHNSEANEIPNVSINSRRTTFLCSPRESDFPLEVPQTNATPQIIDHMDIASTSSHRKRHQLSPTKTNHLIPKKLCVNSTGEILINKVPNTMEDQLKKIQEEILQNQKEDRRSDKLQSFIKPDGFSVMNVMKMKLLANENKYIPKIHKKDNRQHKIITTKNSFDDDTDAPSIISMEEDFMPQPEPLRLEDLQLKLDRSGQTSFTSQLSPETSKTSLSSRRNEIESLKSSSVTSYMFDAPPLVIPESVQNLKLSSNRSYSELSFSSNKVPNSHSNEFGLKVSSHSHSSKSFQENPVSLSYSISAPSKIRSHSRHSSKQNFQEDSMHSESHSKDLRKETQLVQGSNPAALFLQFHAELSRLDAFDQSLAQVIAAERLHSISAHLHVCNRHTRSSPERNSYTLSAGDGRHMSHDRNNRSSQYSSLYEQPSSEPKASPVSDVSSVRTATSQQDRLPASRSASSLHSVTEQVSPVLESTQIEPKEVPQKLSPLLSFSSSVPLSLSPKSIHILQVLIDDAQFQRRQIELMYKTQEDILLTQYKAELSEIEIRYRRNGQLTSTGIESKRILEEKYETPLSKLRGMRDQALANSDARIEYLAKQINCLKKQKKSKTSKPRSAEASPKKLTPLRSISLTSVVENSSSSESSVGLQTYDDKKRQETERDKTTISSRRKVEKEMLRKLQEELARVQELQKVDRSLKSSRSRRDKSTSPLESLPETSTKDAACSVNGTDENVSPQATLSSLRTVEEARSTDVYNSESFESPESSETPRQPRITNVPLASKPLVPARPNYKSKVLIKVPLSPRVQVRSRRRGSSGSDESLLLSQNETQSEQSDYEVRISALKEQKRQRFAELNRLERELKRAQREQLKATESALVKQIQAYELKIAQTKKQLEEVTATNIVRPQIKHPRVSEKFYPRTSDIFQKTQILEELPKQQEQIVSDLDTNSLKSISEASSTETTIQSSGQVPVTEQMSKPSVEIDDDSKDLLSVESEVTDHLSSVATEAPTVLDTQKSVESEIPGMNESVLKSESGNKSHIDINWMDAEEFFTQMDNIEKRSINESEHSKASTDKYASSSVADTNISEDLTNESENKTKSSSSSQEFEDAEEIIATPKTESSVNSTSELENHTNNKSPIEEPSLQTASPGKDDPSNQLDEGRVVSVVSQSPSNKSQTLVSESQSSLNTELQSVSHNSVSTSKPDSNLSQCDEDVNVSIAASEKSDVSEVLSQSIEASVATDSNVLSQCYSGDDRSNSNAQSDGDENYNSSQSEVIKVYVSNKNLENTEEKTAKDNNNVNLNETFVISEAETKSDKSDKYESVVDTITDKILQNLLNECLVCTKDKHSINVPENSPEFDDSDDRIPPQDDVKSKNQLSVNDFTQTVLNKFLKDATDRILQIRDTKKAAQIKSISVNHNKEHELLNNDVSSNKLLEALALERKSSISCDKGREENTPSPKSTRSSNNEVELSEGNESEVFWFDEDLQPVRLQTQREAEELRLKQLQIEQEIEQIKQLEAQENIPYYYCLREIPNKPPPPYTPPGQSSQGKDLRPVPTRRVDIEALVTTATQGLMAVWRRGDNLSAAEPSAEYRSTKIGNQVYNKFLFDLVKQIFIDATSNDEDEKDLPPWERTGCRMKRLVLPKLTEESVSTFVMKKVRVLFGFEPDSIKENLIIQWSRKKRDKVDELLVRESQEEERDWTDYSKCEVAVKNNVALSIFDNLLEETGLEVSKALKTKLAYCQQST